jgi:phage shock protein A
MRGAEVALDQAVPDPVGAAVELRRQAVAALSCQQRLREEADAVRTQAEEIERQASRALARGEDLLARQILARGICTLKARDVLEAQLAETRGRVALILRAMVRTEDRALRERP